MKASMVFACAALLLLGAVNISTAGDLDDGMGKYTDDGIASYDEALKTDKNIKYVVQRAQSKAAVARKSGDKNANAGNGDCYDNSVVMGAGSKVQGDVIIVDNGGNKKSPCE